jgi:hypothetical protein
MPGYDPKLDPLRRVQEAYVDELLSHSLSFGNVLYCMNNETSGPPEWGLYWMSHIRRRAAEAGVDVCVTDMFDDAWRPEESKSFLRVLDEPETYDFVEISQVNSRNFGNDHWRRICWVTESAHVDRPRPVNHTKIYSDGNTGFGSGYPQDGVERFWHNLLAGSAAVRFHRPPAGIALNPLAQACIRSARIVERMVPFWTLRPDDGVVPGGSENGLAYAAVAEDGMAVVFLPRGVAVDALWTRSERVRVDWISVATGARIGVETLEADGELTLKPRLAGPTVAVLRPAP